jgi:CubicO group peptidase (beta-lactamase class C family)
VSAQEQLYRPYGHWQYSNLGMSMLGDVVSKVSGSSWGDYIKQKIFTPLGMKGSTTDMSFDLVGNGFAQGYYVRTAKGERNAAEKHSFKAFAPAAGVASSVHDMAKFAYATRRYDGKTVWGHGGYCPGERTEFTMRLPTKIGVVMMVSVNDISPSTMVETIYSLTEAAITKAYGKKALDAREKASVPDGSKDETKV